MWRLTYLGDGVQAKRGGQQVLATRPKVLRDAQGQRITDRRGPPTKKGMWIKEPAVPGVGRPAPLVLRVRVVTFF